MSKNDQSNSTSPQAHKGVEGHSTGLCGQTTCQAYLNLNEEMIARVPTVYALSNLQKNQDHLNKKYVDYQCGTFMIDNSFLYHILSKVFMDKDAYLYAKERREA